MEVCDFIKIYYIKNGLFIVVNGVDLSIVDGEVLVIVGESGCGKSMLLCLMIGFD